MGVRFMPTVENEKHISGDHISDFARLLISNDRVFDQATDVKTAGSSLLPSFLTALHSTCQAKTKHQGQLAQSGNTAWDLLARHLDQAISIRVFHPVTN